MTSATPAHPINQKPKTKNQNSTSSAPILRTRPAHDPTDQAVHERLIDMLKLIHPDANARQALEFLEQRILDAQQPFDDSEQAHIARRQAALAHIQNLASTPP